MLLYRTDYITCINEFYKKIYNSIMEFMKRMRCAVGKFAQRTQRLSQCQATKRVLGPQNKVM